MFIRDFTNLIWKLRKEFKGSVSYMIQEDTLILNFYHPKRTLKLTLPEYQQKLETFGVEKISKAILFAIESDVGGNMLLVRIRLFLKLYLSSFDIITLSVQEKDLIIKGYYCSVETSYRITDYQNELNEHNVQPSILTLSYIMLSDVLIKIKPELGEYNETIWIITIT